MCETRNAGQSWEPKNLTLPNLEGIISLAIDPTNTQILFAGANTDEASHPMISRLYTSTDGGNTWELTTSNFPDSKRVTSIQFDPCIQDQILISRQKHGVIDSYLRASNDDGQSWYSIPLTDDDISISPVAPCPIYTALHRSLDHGASWEDISYNFYSLIPPNEEVIFSAWATDPWNNLLWMGTRDYGVFYIRGIVPTN